MGVFQDYERDGKCGILSHVNKSFGLGIQIILDSSQTIDFTLRCSYVSIYLEKIYDLLEPNKRKTIQPISYTDDIPNSGEHNELYCFDEQYLLSLVQRGQSSLSFFQNVLKQKETCFILYFAL